MPTGGAEMVILSYLRFFKDDRDIQMHLISLSSNKNRLYERMAQSEGLSISYLNQDIMDNTIVSRIKQIIQLRHAIKAFSPDIIHIHLSILWMVCFAAIGTGTKKKFHTLHSNPEKTSYGKHVYVDRFCYVFFKVRTIALNKEMAEKTNQLFHINNTLVLRNGINLDSYHNQPRSELRRKYGIPDDCFVLGHVGRFNKVKNHRRIIEIFKIVKLRHPNSKLLFVGDGEEESLIQQRVEEIQLKEEVIFMGARNDVPSMMAMMDCFIFPSLYEGLGIVLIEAQAAGLKCVVSDTVPKETTVTDKVYRLPLASDSEIWASVVLGNNDFKPAPITQPIEQYDISNVIAILKEYYECE